MNTCIIGAAHAHVMLKSRHDLRVLVLRYISGAIIVVFTPYAAICSAAGHSDCLPVFKVQVVTLVHIEHSAANTSAGQQTLEEIGNGGLHVGIN